MEKGLISAALPVLVMVAGVSWGGKITDLTERAKQNSVSYRDLDLSEQVKSGAVQANAARKSADYVNGREFRERLNSETERLKRNVFGREFPVYYSDLATDGERKPWLANDERIYIFVSSSIPEATLRAYARDIDRAGDPNIFMVVRGFVEGGGSFAPTMKFISRVLMKDPDCVTASACPSFNAAIEIDPNLYRRFRPERVPAVVFVRGVHPGDAERSEGDLSNVPSPNPSSWWMMYGDASLSFMLSRINEEARTSELNELISMLAR